MQSVAITDERMRLSELQTGEKAYIVKVLGNGSFRKRIIEMGFVRGANVKAILNAPLKDPVEYQVMGYNVSLRKSEASMIEILNEEEFKQTEQENEYHGVLNEDELRQQMLQEKEKTIRVALVGNPNCGKTSLFNFISNSSEHVGNYSGVTVEAKEGRFEFQGYKFVLVDLPGTYSLTSYSPEERYVRNNLVDETPDVIVNVVDSSNLERNLYLTTQLIDMNMPMVVALNMFDDLQAKGDKLDYEQLAKLLGLPMVPTVSRSGKGIDMLFHVVINVYEGYNFITGNGEINKEKFLKEYENNPDKHHPVEGETHQKIYEVVHHIHINHGPVIEDSIARLQAVIKKDKAIRARFSTRFLAIKLIEGDKEVAEQLAGMENAHEIFELQKEEQTRIQKELKEDAESAVSNAKYGFITGALTETLVINKTDDRKLTKTIDKFVTNKYLGFPIFLFFVGIMFECTFSLGKYPMGWIDSLVGWFSELLKTTLPNGVLKDLVVDGIVGGVGGVIVFLPNILILYLFISFMEDSGYMARAAFIMDKVMHKMGLHGKSFIPLIMGFGCNVPAIMGTRIIESRKSRLITMLVLPFMSCSARLPIYLLLIAAFFPHHGSLVLFALYLIGVIMAIIFAKIFRKYFKEDEAPFVLELPPYRMPTGKSVLIHVWEKTKEYLKKMGGVILIATIAVWFLEYFPRDTQYESMKSHPTAQDTIRNAQGETAIGIAAKQQKENSYIGQLGRATEPLIQPLGFSWQMGISLFTGAVAKEVVVSTLTVLYTGNSDSEEALSQRLQTAHSPGGTPVYSPLIAFCFMIFVLLYFPCIATLIAIKNESGHWKWALLSAVYTCILAWTVTFAVYLGLLVGLG